MPVDEDKDLVEMPNGNEVEPSEMKGGELRLVSGY